MSSFQDFVCSLFGCSEEYEATLKQLKKCQTRNKTLGDTCLELAEELDQLKKLIPRPPPPDVTFVVKKSNAWVHQRLMSLEPSIIHLPLDVDYYLTDKANFLNIIAWDWVDTWEYIKDRFDCENFAIAFKAHTDRYFGLNQVGIVIDYEARHAYNIIIFPDGSVMLIEPQSDGLFYWEDAAAILYVLKKSYVIL